MCTDLESYEYHQLEVKAPTKKSRAVRLTMFGGHLGRLVQPDMKYHVATAVGLRLCPSFLHARLRCETVLLLAGESFSARRFQLLTTKRFRQGLNCKMFVPPILLNKLGALGLAALPTICKLPDQSYPTLSQQC